MELGSEFEIFWFSLRMLDYDIDSDIDLVWKIASLG